MKVSEKELNELVQKGNTIIAAIQKGRLEITENVTSLQKSFVRSSKINWLFSWIGIVLAFLSGTLNFAASFASNYSHLQIRTEVYNGDSISGSDNEVLNRIQNEEQKEGIDMFLGAILCLSSIAGGLWLFRTRTNAKRYKLLVDKEYSKFKKNVA
ncbi:MAG: hypothetical protein AB7F43_07725 [Bacteriovoracia bacterium]